MREVPIADAYGGILISANGKILLREPAGHFGGYAWTYAKGKPNAGESPEQTAIRHVLRETGYHAEILGVIPNVFAGTASSTAFFLMGPIGKQGKPSNETSATRWVSFEDARELIGQSRSKTGRERDLAILVVAELAAKDQPWSERPATCKEDWKTKQLPKKRATIALDLRYDEGAMVRIRRGYLPTVMEEKWFAWYWKSVLHFHRSWTGICIFEVQFSKDGDCWRAYSAKVNRNPDQYSETDDDKDSRLVADLIDGWLVNAPEGPAVEPFAAAFELASQQDPDRSTGIGSDIAGFGQRYGAVQQPYYGFEGSFRAQKDGKIWLNNVNLLFPMLADFLVQEIRHFAFNIAGQYDHSAAKWPNIEEAVDNSASEGRWKRLAQFLTIFSGRDQRFAYDDNYLPGGGLEARLLKNYCCEGYDPRYDAEATIWHYPIDSKDPLAAPSNMRLLNMWIYTWDADYYGMAASALCGDLAQVLTGNPVILNDPSDDTPYTYGVVNADDGTLSGRFHTMLCEWVEVFAGVESLDLKKSIEPIMSDAQLFFAILGVYPDQLAEGNVTVVSAPVPDRWRTLEEIHIG